jgi:hypothetical protein
MRERGSPFPCYTGDCSLSPFTRFIVMSDIEKRPADVLATIMGITV